MYNRNDPRIRRALNDIERTLESANSTAQVGLFSLGQNYIRPCLASLTNGLQTCIAPCFPDPESRHRRKRARSRGPESSFDFYDDWAADDEWGNDEFERLLGESQEGEEGDGQGQPGRHATMNYGSVGRQRAKSAVLPYDGGPDPTVIPKSNYFGFLNKLPFQAGSRRGLKYKPSAADLKQVRRGGSRKGEGGIEEEVETQDNGGLRKSGRGRSNTADSDHSGRTVDSYSSRGDIFPSDDEEYGDAVPLDDEFAMALERRSTQDDLSSGKGKRPRFSRNSTHSKSSSNTQRRSRPASTKSANSDPQISQTILEPAPNLRDLEEEERQLRNEEESEIVKRREAAQKLARERGLSTRSELFTAKSSSTISAASLTTYPFPTLDSEATTPDQTRDDRTYRSRSASPTPARTQTQHDQG